MRNAETDAIVQQRLRRTAAALLDDSAVRDELTDAQAKQLLEWALDFLQETAVRTVHLPDADALPLLEMQVTAVRLIMRLINDLVAHPGLLPDEELLSARLVRLGKNLQWLHNSPSDRERVRRLRRFRAQRDTLDREAAFQLLLDAVRV